jgi:aminomethyltransferase
VTQATHALRRSPLHDRHAAAGARLVPFAGWEMPVQYEGIRQEHVAVRTKAGVFDVSHMGEIETSGPGAEEFLQRVLSNDVTKIAERGAQYSVLCREDGGVLDDLFTYRLGPDRFLTVTNASNHERDFAWFEQHAEGFDAQVKDARDDWAMLAVQGPEARAAVERLAEAELPKRMRTAEMAVAGVDCLVCGTGYTGEDGVELLIPPGGAPAVWDALLGEGVVPAGLGARDTLRLEVCFHLYGNDLSEDRNPIEAGLHWCCKLDTGFIGSDALRDLDPDQKLAPFAFTGPGIPRQGNPVKTNAGDGVVTSGTLSPCLDVGIGMAYLPVAAAEPGTRIEVDVRGKARAAEVREKPLYNKETSG